MKLFNYNSGSSIIQFMSHSSLVSIQSEEADKVYHTRSLINVVPEK